MNTGHLSKIWDTDDEFSIWECDTCGTHVVDSEPGDSYWYDGMACPYCKDA